MKWNKISYFYTLFSLFQRTPLIKTSKQLKKITPSLQNCLLEYQAMASLKYEVFPLLFFFIRLNNAFTCIIQKYKRTAKQDKQQTIYEALLRDVEKWLSLMLKETVKESEYSKIMMTSVRNPHEASKNRMKLYLLWKTTT